MELSNRDARKLFLKQQGLLRDNEFGRGRNAARRAIERLSYLQIDTISVVNRAHEHILQTRVANYQPDHLDRLMKDRQLYEYWSHAAAFMPFEAYRYSLPVMKGWRDSRSHDKQLVTYIIDRIRTEGPLSSRQFEAPPGHKSGGWWDWKPAKQALEHLFLAGDLMVSHREGFQKVYNLKENVVPTDVDTSEPTQGEWSEYIVRSMVGALGVATEYDIGYAKSTIRRLAKIALGKPISEAIDRLIEAGELIEVTVDGRTCYTTPDLLSQLPLRSSRKTVRILSPFDNLVINRRRTAELFDFDYQLECYLPEHKRKYGYFVLPMLYGGELIGRLDAKADRKTGTLILKNLVVDHPCDDQLINALTDGITRFAAEHHCETVQLDKCEPQALRKSLLARF